MRSADEITVYSMVATPFDDDGAVDLDAFGQLVDRMARANVGVYLGSGGAGEGHALTLGELRDLYRVGVDVAGHRVPVAANPREPRTAAQMLELALVAAGEGVDLVQLYSLDAGHGMQPTPVELERYYRFVLDRLSHPVAISVHAYYPYRVAPSLLAALCADYPNVEAVNVVMPMAYYLEVRQALADVPREIRLYTSMMALVDGLYAGSWGFQAAEPNLIPHTMRRFVDAVVSGDLATASALYVFVFEFMAVVQQWAPSTARWLKMGLRVLGLPGSNGVLREPYVLPAEDQLATMRREFVALRVEEVEAESAALAGAG